MFSEWARLDACWQKLVTENAKHKTKNAKLLKALWQIDYMCCSQVGFLDGIKRIAQQAIKENT